METKVIYLVECFEVDGKETTNYVCSAWMNKEDAIKEANKILNIWQHEGWNRNESTKEECIGWVYKKIKSKHYWIEEIKLS